MPLTSLPTRAIAAACLVVVTWLSVVPAPVAALEPPSPLPNYRPAFVTETDERPWQDCLWAAGAMLLDKWTNGEVTRTHQQLRSLAGSQGGGSALADLGVAYARLGLDLRFSPDGGARITWSDLLRRLERGAGAVVLGDDADLPRWYGRWDRAFWTLTKKEAADRDNHAVYVERYDRKRGRVWLMDPLGRGDWKGEWISIGALRRFAWSRGGFLSVAVTPTAKAAPYMGVTMTDPKMSMTSTTLVATWGLEAPPKWAFPGADIRAAFEPADDPLRAAVESLPVTMAVAAMADVPTADAPTEPVAALAGASIRAVAALPSAPGAYRATITLTDRRFGDAVADVANVAVFVPGPRRATLRLLSRDHAIEVGGAVSVSLSVANSGTETWAEQGQLSGTPAAVPELAIRETRLVARWILLDGPAEAVSPVPVELRAIALGPGTRTTVTVELGAPGTAGTWALVLDVVDDVAGSFAALGSAPAVQVFEVLARGHPEVE